MRAAFTLLPLLPLVQPVLVDRERSAAVLQLVNDGIHSPSRGTAGRPSVVHEFAYTCGIDAEDLLLAAVAEEVRAEVESAKAARAQRASATEAANDVSAPHCWLSDAARMSCLCRHARLWGPPLKQAVPTCQRNQVTAAAAIVQ